MSENEEIQNVKKPIGESKISEREANVVAKDRIGAPPGSAAMSKKQETCDPHARRERWAHCVWDNNNYSYEIISSTNICDACGA